MDKRMVGLALGLGGLVPVILEAVRKEGVGAGIVGLTVTARTATVVVRNTGNVTSDYEVSILVVDSASGSGCYMDLGTLINVCPLQHITGLAPGATATATGDFSLEAGTYYAVAFLRRADTSECLDGRNVQFTVEDPVQVSAEIVSINVT